MADRPKTTHSASEKALDQAEKQVEAFDQNIQDLTQERTYISTKKPESEGHNLSQKEISKSTDIYLKPHRAIGCRDKFNDRFREQYNHDKEYVQFIAYNHEISGELIDIWTRPYGGMPAEWWKVPCNKPVWGPRYLAEQIKRKFYRRLRTEEAGLRDTPTIPGIEGSGLGQFTGNMIVDKIIQRLDAHPVSSKKSVFMGANNF